MKVKFHVTVVWKRYHLLQWARDRYLAELFSSLSVRWIPHRVAQDSTMGMVHLQRIRGIFGNATAPRDGRHSTGWNMSDNILACVPGRVEQEVAHETNEGNLFRGTGN